jgi:hypothetical protein
MDSDAPSLAVYLLNQLKYLFEVPVSFAWKFTGTMRNEMDDLGDIQRWERQPFFPVWIMTTSVLHGTGILLINLKSRAMGIRFLTIASFLSPYGVIMAIIHSVLALSIVVYTFLTLGAILTYAMDRRPKPHYAPQGDVDVDMEAGQSDRSCLTSDFV